MSRSAERVIFFKVSIFCVMKPSSTRFTAQTAEDEVKVVARIDIAYAEYRATREKMRKLVTYRAGLLIILYV